MSRRINRAVIGGLVLIIVLSTSASVGLTAGSTSKDAPTINETRAQMEQVKKLMEVGGPEVIGASVAAGLGLGLLIGTVGAFVIWGDRI